MRKCLLIPLLLITAISFCGCGYTTGSLLPAHIKNIYVENFANSIPITAEVSEINIYKTYSPRLETDITEAVINKYIFDGHLRITRKEDADIILKGELIDFRREPVKYGYDDSIEEYRLAIIVNMKMTDAKTGKLMWREDGFAGSDYYFLTGPETKSENDALTDALDDLARRIVERTIEVW